MRNVNGTEAMFIKMNNENNASNVHKIALSDSIPSCFSRFLLLNPLKTSSKYTRAGVYGKCVL